MISLLLALLVFLVPSNLFLKFAEETAYVRGLQIDYLIPRISIQMIVMMLLAGALIAKFNKNGYLKNELCKSVGANKVIVILLTILAVRQFFAGHPLIAVETFAEWLLIASIIWMSQLDKIRPLFGRFFTSVYFGWSLIATLIFQSGLAMYQFVTQQSLVGYWLLGEGNMRAFAGLSRIELFGQLLTAPMGTTAHPNVLAGVLAIYLLLGFLLLSQLSKKEKTPIFLGCAGLAALASATALSLASSASAWLALAAGLLALAIKTTKIKKLFSSGLALITLAMPLFIHHAAYRLPETDSLVRRDYLNQAAWKMVAHNILFGVGLQNASAHIETYSPTREVVRFTQPVHHTPLLLLAETGFVGVVLLTLVLSRADRLKKGGLIIAALILASLDHYLLTLDTGRTLLLVMLLLEFIHLSGDSTSQARDQESSAKVV